MPDVTTVEVTQEDILAVPVKKKRRSLLSDPFIRIVVLLIALVIIGALVTAVMAIMNGSIRLEGGPQGLAQALEIRAKAAMQEEGTSAEGYADLIITQVDQGNIPAAQTTLDEARSKKLDVTRNQALDFAEAYILQKTGQLNKSINLYEDVMEKLMTAYTNEKNNGGDMNWATAYGVPYNYYSSAWNLADIYARDGNDKEALKFISTYLEGEPNDAQALTDRGNLYLKLGENAKAKTDFERALRFIPESADASAGLKKAEGK